MGKIVKVSGPLVVATGMEEANMADVVRVGEQRLIGEILTMTGDSASIQVYEETAGLGPGAEVVTTGSPLSVELGPGLVENIYDGIQRPLEEIMKKVQGNNLPRGVEVPALDREKKWDFNATVEPGTQVVGGDIIGTVQETPSILHKIMIPPKMKGKIVSIGAQGSGVYFNAIDVLGAYGMTEADITPVYQSFGDSAESLKDKKIDAAFIVAGAPTTAIVDLSTSAQVYLVSIDDEHMDKLLASSPYYSAYTIAADVYGTPEDVQTVAVAAVVLVRDDVSDDDVYTFVSTIFDNIDAISEQHGKGAELSLEFASSMTSVPYHPGAAKYFAEKGFEVATK